MKNVYSFPLNTLYLYDLIWALAIYVEYFLSLALIASSISRIRWRKLKRRISERKCTGILPHHCQWWNKVWLPQLGNFSRVSADPNYLGTFPLEGYCNHGGENSILSQLRGTKEKWFAAPHKTVVFRPCKTIWPLTSRKSLSERDWQIFCPIHVRVNQKSDMSLLPTYCVSFSFTEGQQS